MAEAEAEGHLHSYPFVETRNQNKTHHHSSIGKPRVSPLLSLNTESAEVATSASFIRVAGEIRNKYKPVTDFVRVVSVGACPKPMTVNF